MRIEVQHAQWRVTEVFGNGEDCAERHRMITTEHHRQLAACEQGGDALLDVGVDGGAGGVDDAMPTRYGRPVSASKRSTW